MKGAQALFRILYKTVFCSCHCCEDESGI